MLRERDRKHETRDVSNIMYLSSIQTDFGILKVLASNELDVVTKCCKQQVEVGRLKVMF